MDPQSRSAVARRRIIEAHKRAVLASERISELRKLRAQLNSGGKLTPTDLARAKLSLRQAADAAHAARLHQRDALVLSAATHRQVADRLTRLGRLEEATRHLEAAEADEHAARVLDG